MNKKTCPNGHVYDQSIYGDKCPLCPPSAGAASADTDFTKVAPESPAGGTHVSRPSGHMGLAPGGFGNPGTKVYPDKGIPDPTGPTHNKNLYQQSNGQQQQQNTTPHTVIRRPAGAMAGQTAKAMENGRKLVGFLVTYNRTPLGKAYNLYEGRNFVGRDTECGICIPDDSQMSGKHLLIRYLNGTFKFKDELSSNGTIVNKQQLDEGELKNHDIIRVGSTLFIFVAIPQP